MLSFRIVLCLAACAISQAQNINFNNTYGFTAGKRLDGDEFLYIGYQISPFFQERSNFSFSFEYNGDEKVANITRIEVKVENTSSMRTTVQRGGIGTSSYKVDISMENIFVTQSVMKIFGFKWPETN